MHNPLYSPGKYGANEDYNLAARILRDQLNPVFSKCGVDLVLTGHDHVYSRTYPISIEGEALLKTKTRTENGISYLLDPQGPVHLASGVAGNQARGIVDGILEADKAMFQEMMATKSEHCYYSAITVEGDTLTVEFYEVDGAKGKSDLRYAWGIVKS